MQFDTETNMQVLKEKIEKFVRERNWDKFHHPKELAISLNLEAAELLEIFQWKDKQPLEKLIKNKKLINNIREELADILIHSIDMANRTGIDLTQAILDKIKENERKYPIEMAKGSAKKYTEIGKR